MRLTFGKHMDGDYSQSILDSCFLLIIANNILAVGHDEIIIHYADDMDVLVIW